MVTYGLDQTRPSPTYLQRRPLCCRNWRSHTWQQSFKTRNTSWWAWWESQHVSYDPLLPITEPYTKVVQFLAWLSQCWAKALRLYGFTVPRILGVGRSMMNVNPQPLYFREEGPLYPFSRTSCMDHRGNMNVVKNTNISPAHNSAITLQYYPGRMKGNKNWRNL